MKGVPTFFACLAVFVCGFTCSAQRSDSRFSILVSPALFVPVSIAAQGGIQYRMNKKFSVLAEGALPVFHPDNTEYESIDYWRTGLELKYFTRKDSLVSKYISVQCNYLFRKLEDNGDGFYYTRTQTFAYSNAIIQSPVLSSAIKLGIEISPNSRFFADVFVGAGVRAIFNEYTTKNALITSTQPPNQSILKFDDAWKYNYTLIRPHATAGVRFGVRL